MTLGTCGQQPLLHYYNNYRNNIVIDHFDHLSESILKNIGSPVKNSEMGNSAADFLKMAELRQNSSMNYTGTNFLQAKAQKT
jgi:hypothetical protein